MTIVGCWVEVKTIQGSRAFPTPGSPRTSERTSMFEVDIETFERCNARPERNKTNWPLVDWLDWELLVDQVLMAATGLICWLNKSKQKFKCVANEFSWLHCTYRFDGQLKTLRAPFILNYKRDTGISDLMEQHNWQLEAYSPVPGLFLFTNVFHVWYRSKLWSLFRFFFL